MEWTLVVARHRSVGMGTKPVKLVWLLLQCTVKETNAAGNVLVMICE